ncbi:type IV toxin-antitoxin system AbiEi family antitoxin domain-containing protein [Pengzhenrongella frigida]|uniref:type IV toxin-antitoxin system AbiEi family antitoxin domain-containing protein n=1 Tax=Pengzhenrongella frigida TaxID=1259133 RepID=UPI0013EAAB66|nr:type IV toxin-antitoxin system AbiEi family antitoxin domain-containing protein [Cellulomonas sp. HLT2-17]
MPTTAEVVARVSRLAAGQWGLLTTAQAVREDVTRLQLTRLAEAGVLERVDRGVYATTSSNDENRDLRSAWLALDPAQTAEERLANPISAGVVSHTSAAGLHKLGDLLDDIPEVTYSHRKQSRRGIRLHRGDLTEADVTLVEGLPTTTEERTVADLLRDGHDPEHIAQIIGQGVRRGVIDPAELAQHLDPLARRHGQQDGHSLVVYLLDLVGLSPTALARDLAKSTAGQELMAAGGLLAVSEMLSSMIPKFDLAPRLALSHFSADILDIGKLDLGRITGLDKLLEAVRLTQFEQMSTNMLPAMRTFAAGIQQPEIQAAIANMRSPALQAGIAQSRTPAARAAIEAAQSPSVRAHQDWMASAEGRRVSQAMRDAAPATDKTEESK